MDAGAKNTEEWSWFILADEAAVPGLLCRLCLIRMTRMSYKNSWLKWFLEYCSGRP